MEFPSHRLHAHNPHQRNVADNERAKRLSDAGLGENAGGRKCSEAEDPELLQQFDNFYQSTKSLLVLFQIMGVVPIERSGLGKTTFR